MGFAGPYYYNTIRVLWSLVVMPSSLVMNDLKDDMNLKYSTMVYWLIDESIL